VKEDQVYLAHIRDAIERIEAFTTGGRDQFFADPNGAGCGHPQS
jgi:uncharacterized protein with HEPN domain